MKKQGFTVWVFGLPFSGKKQLASLISAKLESLGFKTEVLEGGKIRRQFNQKLGYSKEEVYQNIRRICYECQILTENEVVAIAVTISPYKELRDECREKIGRYLEVFCDCPLEVLRERDTKGMFAQAEQGKLRNFAGVSAPFEPPERPEVLYQSDRESPEQGLAKTISTLQMLGFTKKLEHEVLTDEEEELIRQRLKDMGYL